MNYIIIFSFFITFLITEDFYIFSFFYTIFLIQLIIYCLDIALITNE